MRVQLPPLAHSNFQEGALVQSWQASSGSISIPLRTQREGDGSVFVWVVDSTVVLGSARFGMADPERIRIEGKRWRRYEKSGGAPAAGFDSGRFGSEPISPTHEGSFPSGQRGLTVNQVALPSQVRILHFPLPTPCPDTDTRHRSRSHQQAAKAKNEASEKEVCVSPTFQ